MCPPLEARVRKLFSGDETSAEHAETQAAIARAAAALEGAREFITQSMMEFRWARLTPTHPVSKIWISKVGSMTPRELQEEWYSGLLKPPKPVGRPIDVFLQKQVDELQRRFVVNGGSPTTIARAIVSEFDYRGANLKDRADYVVKLWTKQHCKPTSSGKTKRRLFRATESQ